MKQFSIIFLTFSCIYILSSYASDQLENLRAQLNDNDNRIEELKENITMMKAAYEEEEKNLIVHQIKNYKDQETYDLQQKVRSDRKKMEEEMFELLQLKQYNVGLLNDLEKIEAKMAGSAASSLKPSILMYDNGISQLAIFLLLFVMHFFVLNFI